jgi:hypothetical protein
VQLELPVSRSLRTVIDRFKSMDRFCLIQGDMTGSLNFKIENDR